MFSFAYKQGIVLVSAVYIPSTLSKVIRRLRRRRRRRLKLLVLCYQNTSKILLDTVLKCQFVLR